MTLILSLVSKYGVIQVSDRRLSYGKQWRDDIGNKAIVMNGLDATFAISYTGLAKIGPLPTDQWILETLRTNHATKLPFIQILNLMHSSAIKAAARCGFPGVPLTIVFGGYRIVADSPYNRLIPFYQSVGSNTATLVIDKQRHQCLVANGWTPAISKPHKRWMVGRLRKPEFSRRPLLSIAEEIVSYVRGAAKYGGSVTIGQDCMSAMINPYDIGTFSTHYHPLNSGLSSYSPHVVFENGLYIQGPTIRKVIP